MAVSVLFKMQLTSACRNFFNVIGSWFSLYSNSCISFYFLLIFTIAFIISVSLLLMVIGAFLRAFDLMLFGIILMASRC